MAEEHGLKLQKFKSKPRRDRDPFEAALEGASRKATKQARRRTGDSGLGGGHYVVHSSL